MLLITFLLENNVVSTFQVSVKVSGYVGINLLYKVCQSHEEKGPSLGPWHRLRPAGSLSTQEAESSRRTQVHSETKGEGSGVGVEGTVGQRFYLGSI